MKFEVWGMALCSLCVIVDAEDEESAIKEADEQFGGIVSYAGNGGTNKLIGVSGTNESIIPGCYIEWEAADADV